MSISHPGAVAAFTGPSSAQRPSGARPGRADGGFATTLAGAIGSDRSAARPAARDETAASRGASGGAATAEQPEARWNVAEVSREETRDDTAAEDKSEVSAPEAAAAAGAADPSRRVSSTGALDPEFRARLQRVVDRMEGEHGHRVEILETVRSQERQEHLFAQGRSRPGPVVTWTLNSNHRSGRAADLLIDGKWDNPAGYRHLAKIAAEEGLRTLGARDPGHVELPRGLNGGARIAGSADPALIAAQATGANAARTSSADERHAAVGPGGIARVAGVAQVASVARVAEVARVAVPGREGRRSGGAGEGDGGQQPAMVEATFARAEALGAMGGAREGGGAGATDMAGRLARILEMKDAGGTSQLGSMVLRMENGAGGEDRVRVAMRGNAIGATIEPGAGSDAERMLRQLPELHRTLERQGVRAEGITVRTVGPTAEATPETLRLALDSSAETARQGQGNRSGSDGNARDPRSFADQDQPRRRNTGNGHEEPEQDDQERRS